MSQFMMKYRYNDTGAHQLGFRADEDARTQLDDITHALEVLSNAASCCQDQDMRMPEVYEALDYMVSIASQRAALIAYRSGLDVNHPHERKMRVESALRSIKKALNR